MVVTTGWRCLEALFYPLSCRFFNWQCFYQLGNDVLPAGVLLHQKLLHQLLASQPVQPHTCLPLRHDLGYDKVLHLVRVLAVRTSTQFNRTFPKFNHTNHLLGRIVGQQ